MNTSDMTLRDAAKRLWEQKFFFCRPLVAQRILAVYRRLIYRRIRCILSAGSRFSGCGRSIFYGDSRNDIRRHVRYVRHRRVLLEHRFFRSRAYAQCPPASRHRKIRLVAAAVPHPRHRRIHSLLLVRPPIRPRQSIWPKRNINRPTNAPLLSTVETSGASRYVRKKAAEFHAQKNPPDFQRRKSDGCQKGDMSYASYRNGKWITECRSYEPIRPAAAFPSAR